MNTELRMDREKAKELLAQIESSAASAAKPAEARQKVVKLLNTIPTYDWVGVYLVKGPNLALDSWSGPAATIHKAIPMGKGVSGFSAKAGSTEIVSDVSKDARYLECFASTKAEIAVPIRHDGKVVGEVDIYSDELNAFSSTDREFLEAVAVKLARYCM